MSYTEINLKKIEDYFRRSCKKEDEPFKLGVEIEHFIMDKKEKRSILFEGEKGVLAILERLAPEYEIKHYQDGYLVGLENDEYNITLEPSCQFEISIMPEERLSDIRSIYDSFTDKIKPILDEFGYEFLNYGYNPYEKNSEMSLIPKKRYAFMDRYFKEIGTKGSYMMRSTASTQVSIDFYSEDDFKNKFKSVYILGPVLALFADNCPIYEGEENKIHIRRQKVWRDVDPKRVNVFDHMPFDDFGFRDYAEFVYNTPLIVNLTEDGCEYTEKNAKEIFADKEVTEDDIKHILSMVFPMARLKNYVEIRCADSMPIERSLQLTALIKGIYRKPQKLNDLMKKFVIESAADTITAEDEVMEKGYDAVIYGMKVKDIISELINIAKENLDEEERQYLC